MGQQIIRQPNGLYCMFSSIVDNVTVFDATIDELVEDAVAAYREDLKKRFAGIAHQLDRGEKPYHQFTMSFDEMVKRIKRIHGKDDVDLLHFLDSACTIP